MSDLVIDLRRARNLAELAHTDVGQRYGEGPYTVHLDAVRSVAFEFGIVDPAILVATLLHDVIEDTKTTREQIEGIFGTRVADLVDAVTDPPGHPNRKTRKAASYPRILAVPGATKLKLADRIANVRSCWAVATAGAKRSKSLLGMYKREYGGFRKALRPEREIDPVEVAMWNELDRLLAWRP